ncbi:MAG: alkaline phosphatase family protein [Nanoarchaeota archaeon]
MTKLNWVMFDAFKEDYLKYAPFMSSLENRTKVEPVIGYQQYIASLLTGYKPEEINVWAIFRKENNSKLFGWTKPLKNLKFLDNYYLKLFLDGLSFSKVGTIDMIKAMIPIKVMHNFSIGQMKAITTKNCLNKPTIFDLLRKDNLSYRYIKGAIVSVNGKETLLQNAKHIMKRPSENTIKLAKNKKEDLLFIYLLELDGLGHRYGPRSKEVKEHVKKIDLLLENYLKNKKFILHSDHGMIEVKKQVNIKKEIESLNLTLGKDYLYFLDSVVARFWFFNENAKRLIIEKLENIKEGFILKLPDLVRYGINFKDNRFFDLAFIMNHGNIIIPNFFQERSNVKGMHGYLPNKDENGIFTSNLNLRKTDKVKYMDINATVLKHFNLNYPTQGNSLL